MITEIGGIYSRLMISSKKPPGDSFTCNLSLARRPIDPVERVNGGRVFDSAAATVLFQIKVGYQCGSLPCQPVNAWLKGLQHRSDT